ncbi:MAG: putative N-acyltransferase [Halieaceae bacterium]|jgi:predicted N-acyltransferase
MAELELRFYPSIGELPAEVWNGLFGIDYPFTRHEFLSALEEGGCTTKDSGWQPNHAILYREDTAIAAMPLYIKSHSYGEYVFDWSWADAYRRHNLDYYPKLLSAIPFTPATGPRLAVAEGENKVEITTILCAAICDFCTQQGLSSWHILFPEKEASERLVAGGLMSRHGSQFHWFNRGYSSFDDFLSGFNSRKRKGLKRERRRVAEQGIELRTLEGSDISPENWAQFFRFYQITYAKRSGHGGYLSLECFQALARLMPEQIVMVLARQGDLNVAGALYFRSGQTLYGRYWGCIKELDCLHFEACYYQGIEYCIREGLQKFDPGAQGEHKIQRGFEPSKTWSNHWIAHPEFAAAIDNFTRQETDQIEHYIQQASEYLPFKKPS